MSTPAPPPAEAAAVYNSLLDDASLADASLDALTRIQRDRNLTFGDRPLSVSLRPGLLTAARWRAAKDAARTMYGALLRLERALLADASLRAQLCLDPAEERLALAEPGSATSSPSARLDSFFDTEVRYVEYNAESPAGMAYGDALSETFDALPVMREFRRRYRLRRLPVRDHQLDAMLRSFTEWGRSETPVVAIVDWEGLPTQSEFELFQAHLRARGVRCVICDPRALSFRRGALYAGSTRVNLVYRRVLTSELLTRGTEAGALADAYLAGAACVVNTFRAKLLHKKMTLALLSDDRWAAIYTATQRRAIARHVPWTRRFVDELVDFAQGNRRRLVLKPNDEYGGKGVVLGWQVDRAGWERALKTALEEPYVIQEAVSVPREQFPIAVDGIELMDLAVDVDPYLFHGRPKGALTRLSSSDLLNVTAGEGSVVPTYVVEGPR